MMRQPIVAMVGHVDSGKTSILDLIRGSSVVKRESGGITQHIGSTSVPIKVIQKISSDLMKKSSVKTNIPGLLFLDTPGHKAFNNLRKRGGNLADVSIVVVDVLKGIEDQTVESIEILRSYKTPFIIALNKIDLIPGWKNYDGLILESIEKQSESTRNFLEQKLYEVVGKLYDLKFNSERFDRIKDYSKNIAIIPISAKTGEGLQELLMFLSGLAQRFLEECLKCDIKGRAKGTVLEVKETKGMGKTIDVIIHDGNLKINDIIVIGGVNNAIVTKVKTLLEPGALSEIRDKRSKFKQVNHVGAACGVKISALNLDDIVAGMPLQSCGEGEIEKIKIEIQKEVKEVLIEVDKKGIIIKADTLGSLEALISLLKERGINVKKASVGDINKKDISNAESEKDLLNRVILGFNVKINEKGDVKIIAGDIIYRIIEDYEKWLEEENNKLALKTLGKIKKICKIKVMDGYIFRKSNPAVVGVEILSGELTTNTDLMDDKGVNICTVKSIQLDGKSINKVEKGKEVAVSLPGVTVGRQVKEEDILYSNINEMDFIELKNKRKYLNKSEIEVLKEIAKVKRKKEPMWGV